MKLAIDKQHRSDTIQPTWGFSSDAPDPNLLRSEEQWSYMCHHWEYAED